MQSAKRGVQSACGARAERAAECAQSAAERVQAVVCLGEAHEPAGLLEDGLLDRLALLEAVCRLVGDQHDLAAVGVQPPQHRLRVCGRRGSSRWVEAKAGSASPASVPELREQGSAPRGGVWARLRVHAASVSSCEALPQERTGCLDRQHRRHVREQVGPRVRIEATERGLGERVVEVEGGDLRGWCRREVRPHEERAANDAPSRRDLDAAQGCAHVALALAPQCGARLQLILTVAELYHVQRRTAAGTGSPSQSSWCDQPRGMGRADKGRERALEHCLLLSVALVGAVLAAAGAQLPAEHTATYDTRVQSKIHSLANLAAARATCQPAAAARRSQARRGAHPTQNAGVHLRPRLRPAHVRVRGRRAVVEDLPMAGRRPRMIHAALDGRPHCALVCFHSRFGKAIVSHLTSHPPCRPRSEHRRTTCCPSAHGCSKTAGSRLKIDAEGNAEPEHLKIAAVALF